MARSSLPNVFSVADKSGSGEMITNNQIPYVFWFATWNASSSFQQMTAMQIWSIICTPFKKKKNYTVAFMVLLYFLPLKKKMFLFKTFKKIN